MVAVRLEPLGTVRWGERLLLARRRAGVNLDVVAEAISRVIPVSYGTLNRLEKLASPPCDKRRRLVAFLALLVYGFDPGDFDLTVADVPPGLDRAKLAELFSAPRVALRSLGSPAKGA